MEKLLNSGKFLVKATRMKDWKASFLPFVLGFVYVWLLKFGYQPDATTLFLCFLSLATTMGFASFGYLMNEFFDQKEDEKAGKINKLKGVSIPVVGLLFGLSLAVMLLPWLVLPFDEWSLILIALELGSFLVYSIPPLRLKRFPLPACLLDTAYAYVWPMALSMHTFAIQSSWQVQSWFNFLLAALFFIGFRNIVLHQIKDAVADFNSGRKTLPLVVGANKTYRILQLVLALEILLFTLFLLFFHRYGSLFALSYSIYLVWKYNSIQKGLSPLPSQAFQVFYLSDLFYQLWLPMLIIGVLVKQDVRWLYLFLFHLLVLAFNFRRLILGGELAEIYHKTILHGISMVVNTIIYYVFRMFGVDLKLEKMSALDYLNSKKRKQ